MPSPDWDKIPSEHSIEVMGNHCLLDALGNPHAWMFCPTTNEEVKLGFDAALQGMKSLVIQYKALHYVYASGALHVKAPAPQRNALNALCPPIGRPYVFYAFNRAPTYDALAFSYAAAPPTFFSQCVFVDVHTVPAATDRFRVTGAIVEAFDGAALLAPIPTAYTHAQVIAGIQNCTFGLRPQDERPIQPRLAFGQRVTILQYPIP
jgi:hypothetical protein